MATTQEAKSTDTNDDRATRAMPPVVMLIEVVLITNHCVVESAERRTPVLLRVCRASQGTVQGFSAEVLASRGLVRTSSGVLCLFGEAAIPEAERPQRVGIGGSEAVE